MRRPSRNTGRHATATAIMTQTSKFRTAGAMSRPAALTNPEIPRQPRMLKVLLPITLPTAMSRSPRIAAMIDVATSGIDVPAAMIVRPITRSLTPSARANTTAASTSQFEPSTSSPRPATISSTCTAQWLSHSPVRGTPDAYSSRISLVSARDWRTRKTT